jgi:hypothetical protein
MKLLMENWRKYLKEDRQLDDEMAAKASDNRAAAAARALEAAGKEAGQDSLKCPQTFTREPDTAHGEFIPEPGGNWIKDRKNPENYLLIGDQTIMYADCNPDSFDGERYIVWSSEKVPLPSPGFHMETRPKGSIYGSEQKYHTHSADLETAEREARRFVNSPGGKEILARGDSIHLHDRDKEATWNDSATWSRKSAPTEEEA